MSASTVKRIFFFLVCASLFSILFLDRNLAYPFITGRVLLFRSIIELALPFYVFLVFSHEELRPNIKNPVSLTVLVFLLLSLVSAVFGVNFGRSFWGNFERMGGVFYLAHLTLLYFYLEALAKISGIKFEQVLKILAILGLAASVYALLTKLGFPAKLYPDDSLPSRASGFFGNPIFFASFLIFPAFLSSFFSLRAENKNSRRFWAAAFALNLIGIYLSATRGAFLGLVVGFGAGLFIWALMSKKKQVRLYGLGAMVFALAVFLLIILASKSLPEGSILRRLSDFGDSNTRARIIQWGAGFKGFKEHPLLGVGPENYYIIGNKYFNPQIYQYDRSWFDKPHNYPLEVLLTTGSLGFAAYLGLIVFSVYGCYRAYGSQMLSLLEFCLLLAAITAYQVQNLFVFDTVAASMAFFCFTAFAAFLWQAAEPTRHPHDQTHPSPKPSWLAASSPAALFVSSLLALYLIFVTNYLPAKAMTDLNNGVSTGTHDPLKAREFFDQAFVDYMNFDYNESATKYEEFASEFSLFFQDKQDRPQVIEAVKGALAAMEKAVVRVNNDPILWFKLTNLRATLTSLTQSPYNPQIEESANKSLSLAPSRVEPRYFLVQALQLKKDFKAAEKQQYEIIKIDFDNPFNFWRLALLYRDAGDMFRAYNMALYARKNGYEFRNLAESIWFTQYYSDLNQFNELAKIYEELIKNGLANYQTYANLATTYARLGEKEKARVMANKVLELSPESKASVEEFLKKLESGQDF